MDSEVVNKRIRAEIRPFLKDAGFTGFTGRDSWRYSERRIDVINFQSFNSYHASAMGCTTYSFAVNVGIYSLDIPVQDGGGHIKSKDGTLRPKEHECHFRGRLHRSFRQREYGPRDIWYIDPRGLYLHKALHDVRMVIARVGLSWFDRLAEPAEALRILLEEDEDMERLWGFGVNPSPIRHYFIGYLALASGRFDLARHHLRSALESGCFGEVSDRIWQDLRRAV